MHERLKFVAQLLEREKKAGLCCEFGISRKTGYKIRTRYKTSAWRGSPTARFNPATTQPAAGARTSCSGKPSSMPSSTATTGSGRTKRSTWAATRLTDMCLQRAHCLPELDYLFHDKKHAGRVHSRRRALGGSDHHHKRSSRRVAHRKT
jgi:hypothetical protein